MKFSITFRTTVVFVAALAAQCVYAQSLVIRNVNGYALGAAGVERFSTLVVRDGKVAQRIVDEQVTTAIDNVTTIDGKGATLLPGLIDAHGHVLSLGEQRLQVDLRGSASVDAALDRVRTFANANKNDRWVLGRGWNQVLWPDKKFPTARQLDAIVADRPALLSRVDGHAVWVNTVALKLAGITRTTADPSGGQIIRDADGTPTGVLVDNATSLAERLLPAATDADALRALQTAMSELVALGLTGVHDAGVDPVTFRRYEELGKQNKLPLRVYAMLADDKSVRNQISAGPKPSQFDDRLHLRAIKAWVDGALGSRGAALLEDYTDQPGHRGLMLYSAAEMQTLAELAGKHGWQLNVHAIGDQGNRVALDAFEKGMTAEQRRVLRPRIEHAQVIALEDIPRFARLGVIASLQPTHATSDMNMAEDRIGSRRIQGAYAWRKLKDAGAKLAGGSDFPVELANPFHGLYAAVTRMSRDGKPPGGWYPKEKLSREEALRLFTADAAYAAHLEKKTGALQSGEWADFILIDRDYFSVPETDIDDIKVVATYVGGRQVFGGK